MRLMKLGVHPFIGDCLSIDGGALVVVDCDCDCERDCDWLH